MSDVNAAKDFSLSNQNISLLTTSGMLELYVLSVGNGVSWVVPQTLSVEVITLKPTSDKEIVWQGKKIPLVMLTDKKNVSHALVIDGVQDQLRYAIATTSEPILVNVKMSSLKDVDALADAKSTSKASQYVYQHIQHADQTWVVPDLEEVERSFK